MLIKTFCISIVLLFLCQITFGQKHDKWILIKGRVVDTFGYSISNARIALISKNGYDKCIKNTDSFGQFYFKLKKKKIDNYSLRCYFFGNLNSNNLLSVKDFIKNDKYIVATNSFNLIHHIANFINPNSPYLKSITKKSVNCQSSLIECGPLNDSKYERNIPVDQTSPTEILKSQSSFLK